MEENVMSRGLAFLVSIIVCWHAASALALTVSRFSTL
jgi:hypothetical protein